MEECKTHKEVQTVQDPTGTPEIIALRLEGPNENTPKGSDDEAPGSLIVEEAQLARLASWAKGAQVEISKPKEGPYAALEKEALEVARDVDECIENARCDGNCNHNACKSKENHELGKVTCHDCK